MWMIYVMAVLGAIWLAIEVVWPITWAAMYATGRLIFLVRALSADGRGVRWKLVARFGPAEWWRGFVEGLVGWPASEITIGRMRWTPLFGYHGFGSDHENWAESNGGSD